MGGFREKAFTISDVSAPEASPRTFQFGDIAFKVPAGWDDGRENAASQQAEPGLDVLNPKEFQLLPSKDPAANISDFETAGFVAHGRETLPAVPFQLPFEWNADPYNDRNWMYQLHAWRMLDPYLNRLIAVSQTLSLTELHTAPRQQPEISRDYARVLDIITDWHRDNIKGTQGTFTWYDMAAGLRAGKLALLIMLARRHGVQLPDPGMLSELVELHIAELSDPEKMSRGNHGLFQMNGLMALVHACPDNPSARAAEPYAVATMSALTDAQLGEVGVHTEAFTRTIISSYSGYFGICSARLGGRSRPWRMRKTNWLRLSEPASGSLNLPGAACRSGIVRRRSTTQIRRH